MDSLKSRGGVCFPDQDEASNRKSNTQRSHNGQGRSLRGVGVAEKKVGMYLGFPRQIEIDGEKQGMMMGNGRLSAGEIAFIYFIFFPSPHAVSQTGSTEMHFRNVTCPDPMGCPGDSDGKPSA